MTHCSLTDNETIKRLVAAENRRIDGEAALTFVVGVVTVIVVFGVTLWLSWLAFTIFLRNLVIQDAFTSAVVVTGLFFLVSIWSAWRRHDPINHVEAMNEDLHDLSVGLGYAFGVPIVNRQSVAGLASLSIGGPANLMEACSLFRSRISADYASLAHAAEILHHSRNGLPASMVKDGKAVSMLARLKLIKSHNDPTRGLTILATHKGLEALDSRHVASTALKS